jgi:ribonuclease III
VCDFQEIPGSGVISAERAICLAELQQRLAYTFRDLRKLHCALTHRSYVHESATRAADYERLEFLGDAVLGLIVGTYLYLRYPHYSEGQLSQLRARVVSTSGLAELARQLRLGDFLLLGRGEEQSGGRAKESILAAAFEAVIAAIYLDASLQVTQAWFLRHFAPIIEHWITATWDRDYKSLVQAHTLRMFGCIPMYRVVREDGPAHCKTFHVCLTLSPDYECTGAGPSKKIAEQEAAKQLLALLHYASASS